MKDGLTFSDDEKLSTCFCCDSSAMNRTNESTSLNNATLNSNTSSEFPVVQKELPGCTIGKLNHTINQTNPPIYQTYPGGLERNLSTINEVDSSLFPDSTINMMSEVGDNHDFHNYDNYGASISGRTSDEINVKKHIEGHTGETSITNNYNTTDIIYEQSSSDSTEPLFEDVTNSIFPSTTSYNTTSYNYNIPSPGHINNNLGNIGNGTSNNTGALTTTSTLGVLQNKNICPHVADMNQIDMNQIITMSDQLHPVKLAPELTPEVSNSGIECTKYTRALDKSPHILEIMMAHHGLSSKSIFSDNNFNSASNVQQNDTNIMNTFSNQVVQQQQAQLCAGKKLTTSDIITNNTSYSSLNADNHYESSSNCEFNLQNNGLGDHHHHYVISKELDTYYSTPIQNFMSEMDLENQVVHELSSTQMDNLLLDQDQQYDRNQHDHLLDSPQYVGITSNIQFPNAVSPYAAIAAAQINALRRFERLQSINADEKKWQPSLELCPILEDEIYFNNTDDTDYMDDSKCNKKCGSFFQWFFTGRWWSNWWSNNSSTSRSESLSSSSNLNYHNGLVANNRTRSNSTTSSSLLRNNNNITQNRYNRNNITNTSTKITDNRTNNTKITSERKVNTNRSSRSSSVINRESLQEAARIIASSRR